jgi:hypothetical protein
VDLCLKTGRDLGGAVALVARWGTGDVAVRGWKDKQRQRRNTGVSPLRRAKGRAAPVEITWFVGGKGASIPLSAGARFCCGVCGGLKPHPFKAGVSSEILRNVRPGRQVCWDPSLADGVSRCG